MEASVVVKGRIVGVQPAGPHELVLDLSVELLTVDGVHVVSRNSDVSSLPLLGLAVPNVALAAGTKGVTETALVGKSRSMRSMGAGELAR
ncbi:hypothetical protein EFP19_15285 [Burkholderia glumae]|nr:hypothetical protein EFP19_15285 [Burkholderia glumae]